MPFPNFKNKHLKDSVFSPKDFILYKKLLGQLPKGRPPEGVIICYDRKLMQNIVEKQKAKKLNFFMGDFYLLPETKNKLGIIGNFGIGSSVSAIVLEELIACGIKKFVTIGAAGALNRHLEIGDIVLPDRAIRDEGTSHHYFKYAKYSYPSKKLNRRLEFILSRNRIDFTIGPSWTTDAPYRETKEELIKYRDEGVLTVEMESAGIYAVSEYRKISSSSIFVISDVLTENGWHQYFKHNDVLNSFKTLFKIVIMELLEDL